VCKPAEKLQETFDLCKCKQRLLYQILTLIFSGVHTLWFLDYVSQRGHAPTMTISDPSMISKREYLQNSRVFKNLFSWKQLLFI